MTNNRLTPKSKAIEYLIPKAITGKVNLGSNHYSGDDVAKALDLALKAQARQIKRLFSQHCDGCEMCGTCESEFNDWFLK